MSIDLGIEERVARIPWFGRCGAVDELLIKLPSRLIPSWFEAEQCFLDPVWEQATAEAQGLLTEFLSSGFASAYQGRWNTQATEARDLVHRIVLPNAREWQTQHGISSAFVDCVEWDTLHAVMELSYAEFGPPEFFRQLLRVYEQGHFPCGWEGEWPDGVLLVI